MMIKHGFHLFEIQLSSNFGWDSKYVNAMVGFHLNVQGNYYLLRLVLVSSKTSKFCHCTES